MEENNNRPMGLGHDKRGLQIGISGKTSIQWSETHKCTSKRTNFIKRRNRKFIAKECHRNCQPKSNSQRFLQYVISSSKKEWGNASSNKFEAPQQVPPETAFQNGYTGKSNKLSRERRLGNNIRFKRCLSPLDVIQGSSEILEIPISRHSIPVPLFVLRSNKRSKSFCESNDCNSSSFEKVGSSFDKLHRRLVNPEPINVRPIRKQEFIARSPLSVGINDKQKEITVSTCSDNNVFRKSVRFSKRSGFSHSREVVKDKGSCDGIVKGKGLCKTVHGSSRNDCFLPGTDPICEIVHETTSIAFVTKLEPCSNAFNMQNHCYTTACSSFKLVVGQSEHSQGQIFKQTCISNHLDHRCKWKMGMGWSLEQSHMSGSMVSAGEDVTHKCIGNESSHFEFTAFPISTSRSECINQVRQHNCLSVHQSSRWNKVCTVVCSDSGPLAIGSEIQHQSESSTYYGKQKCTGRHFESPISETNRVVIEQSNSMGNFQVMGSAINRSILNNGKQEDSSVLLMDLPSTGICNGCSNNCLGEHVCLRISASTIDSQGDQSFSSISVPNDFNSTNVAQTTLVSSNSEVSNSLSDKTSMQSGSSDSVQRESGTPKSTVPTSDCMVVIDKKYSSAGFSEKTRILLSKSWRKGTQKDYKCKFRQFHSWCSKQQIDTYTADLVQCAEFLTFLFEKGLKYRTINGYRSMLSSVIPPVGNIPVGQHPYIIRLLKGIFNERPPLRRLIPEWDLLLILGCLKKAPFEPLKDAPLKFLTWKTCFLVAITTFRRCSDLQALQLGEGYANVQKQGITFLRTGLSKTDRPSHLSRNIVVPHLPNDKKLDPKRAVAYYLKETEKFRKSTSGNDVLKLFLAVNRPHKPVTSVTISRWLVNLIKFCYKELNKTSGRVTGHSTRSIGPSWALFKGASLQQVMEAADWSRETTFTRHYLKAVNVDFFNV